MTGRRVHYELAFEDYLRGRRLPYVAVHEARRAIGAGGSIKAFDFIVYSRRSFNLLVDIKGRRLPARTAGLSSYWQNWSTVDDLTGLDRWQRTFGPDFRAVLVFAYSLGKAPAEAAPPPLAAPEGSWTLTSAVPYPFQDTHIFHDHVYGLVAVSLEAYQRHQRPRSARWQTVCVPQRIFKLISRPISYFLGD